MVTTHNLGFPRIGTKRELKFAVERFWKGEIDQNALELQGKWIRTDNWKKQIEAQQTYLSVGDFSWYDHVLDTSILLGVIPERFGTHEPDIHTYFRMARGRAPIGEDIHACEMTKWFDTNYHYIVPEFQRNQHFQLNGHKLFSEIAEAEQLRKPIKPILLGPLSYLWLGKSKQNDFDKLLLLDNLLPVYTKILNKLSELNIEWVQLDEPILVLDLPIQWQNAFKNVYQHLQKSHLNILLTTYFGHLKNNTQLACELPTAGLHVDFVRTPDQIENVLQYLPKDKILSAGIVDGRNIWRNDFRKTLKFLRPLHQILKNRLWIASSCSLLHCPVDLDHEIKLDADIKSWLSFAKQKLAEMHFLSTALELGDSAIEKVLKENESATTSRQQSKRIHQSDVKKRCQAITPEMIKRKNPYFYRKKIQHALLQLPLFPTTTIGSFPQTQDIRSLRHQYKSGKIDFNSYREKICHEIESAIDKQIALDIDVLVHGESERNDMVEYFGELLDGFAFTENGWVQSYGSRCVKPPIIFGDVSRPTQMTVDWISYAQSLTTKPVKGMLTGPITILCWSFVRDDQSRFETAKQIALALRDEVSDLVAAGTQIIQIDEPAFREGLPLHTSDWDDYLREAVYCFRLASSGVDDAIQIHTHMCYSEFNDIISSIGDLDADVITIETSRSDMELLKAFEQYKYPNEIGPGVYDIHSPRIPTVSEIVKLIEKASDSISIQQLWINPDCGLKTRDWKETESALKNMVTAAKRLRDKYKSLNPNDVALLSTG